MFGKRNNQKVDKKETSSNVLQKVLHGQVVSSDFFAKNWLIIALIVFLFLIYISGKYTYLTKIEQVRQLEEELEIVQAERVRAKSNYMSKVRESSIQELVKEHNLDLTVRETPPYVLSKEDSEK